MNESQIHVALVCGPDCGMETQAVRAALECFGARVVTYWVGRPEHLMNILSGKDLYPDTSILIFDFHGEDGQFIMPELGEDIYYDYEPRKNFGPAEIKQFARLDGKIILANGCTLGAPETAEAFLQGGCSTFIGPGDYPDGNAALLFAIRLMYEIIQNHKSVDEAYELARSTDEQEMSMYQIYKQA
ncbi:delta-aminolevulinic acid dehydratase [Paenibacillus sp. CAA11]|uniref:delta-aminolevulinic acid dehydratase n=1 Tax=Paenibacillus sp. CAA11 TaxID=1532905 RepID=UPI000D387081|nr:delta-aminolevulinic acid dehydratase [Paenibacillus sp. CAA11]AWB43887.1 delta-aminolevulinic acid dehydratase [Paenibacillus sp. CAA11]